MKKKFKYLLCLIALTVLSSVVLCSGLSVNADEWGYQYESKVYEGRAIADFFRKGTIDVYAFPYGADSQPGFNLDDYLQDPDDYQALFEGYPLNPSSSVEAAYLVINFPNHSLVDHKTVRIKFKSFLPYYCTTLNTAVTLKRPTPSTEMHLTTTLNATNYYPEDPSDFVYAGTPSPVADPFPKYNGYDLGNGLWKIHESNPFLNDWVRSSQSYRSNIQFNSRSIGYLTYNIDSMTIDCGQINSGGAFCLKFDPVRITYMLGNPADIERAIIQNGEKLYGRLPADIEVIEEYLARLDEQWRNDQTRLDEMEKVTETFNQLYFPDFVYDWGEVNQGDFSTGFTALGNGMAPVFQDDLIVTIFGIISPVVICSYLLFGRKG